jgi:hypothetical protein
MEQPANARAAMLVALVEVWILPAQHALEGYVLFTQFRVAL